jgi:hypothetical protein
MRRLILALCFLLLAAPAMAQRDGLYDVSGTNLDGTEYTGVAQIRSLGLTSFNILWRINDQIVEGVGMAYGRSIAVAYGLSQRPGMGIYTLNPDGSLEGEWTIIGAPATGRERLVPRAATPPAAAPAAPAPGASATPGTAPAAPAPAPAPAPATPR